MVAILVLNALDCFKNVEGRVSIDDNHVRRIAPAPLNVKKEICN